MTVRKLENDTTFQRIRNLKLDEVVARAANRHGWSDFGRAMAAEMFYRQYLYLRCRHPEARIVAFSADVDAIWHEHILDTQQYMADCRAVCGELIHHDPKFKRGTPEFTAAAARTLELYNATFPPLAKAQFPDALHGPPDISIFDNLGPDDEDFETCA